MTSNTVKDPERDKLTINALDRCESIIRVLSIEADEDSLWTGFLTTRFRELGYSNPHYGETMTYLIELGCVEQIRRGAGGTPSIWRVLKREIDRESFITLYQERLSSKESKKSLGKRVDLLEDKVDQLTKRLNERDRLDQEAVRRVQSEEHPEARA